MPEASSPSSQQTPSPSVQHKVHSPGPSAPKAPDADTQKGGRSAVSPAEQKRQADAKIGTPNASLPQAMPALPPRQGASFLESVRESQQNFRSDSRIKQYEKPLLTVDVNVFTICDGKLKILLVQRKAEPYHNMWSIPGGFMNIGETLDEAANRRLFDRTGVKEIYLEQLSTFGEPRRDPRSRVITVAYIALVASHRLQLDVHANEETRWFDVDNLPPLAFDHRIIVDVAINRLRERLEISGLAFQLLSEKFTLTELQRIYETILGKKLDKRNFRKKILAIDTVQELEGETKMEGFHRPAQLYAVKTAI